MTENSDDVTNTKVCGYLRSWKKPPPLFHKMYCTNGSWGGGETDSGWRERWLTWKWMFAALRCWWIEQVYLLSGCEGGRKRKRCFFAIVFAHVPSSVCVPLPARAWICMCVFTQGPTCSLSRDWSPHDGRSLEDWTDFPYLSIYGNVKFKKCMPFSEVAAQSFVW